MAKGHQTWIAQLGLRGGGLCSLILGCLVMRGLYHQVHAHPLHEASLGELGWCAIALIGVLTGNALLMVGPKLLKRVPVPGRRSFRIPDETSLRLDGGSTNDNAQVVRAGYQDRRLPQRRA